MCRCNIRLMLYMLIMCNTTTAFVNNFTLRKFVIYVLDATLFFTSGSTGIFEWIDFLYLYQSKLLWCHWKIQVREVYIVVIQGMWMSCIQIFHRPSVILKQNYLLLLHRMQLLRRHLLNQCGIFITLNAFCQICINTQDDSTPCHGTYIIVK